MFWLFLRQKDQQQVPSLVEIEPAEHFEQEGPTAYGDLKSLSQWEESPQKTGASLPLGSSEVHKCKYQLVQQANTTCILYNVDQVVFFREFKYLFDI